MMRLGAKDILRINADDPGQSGVTIKIDGNDFIFSVRRRNVSLCDIEAVWYRKGAFWFNGFFHNAEIEGHDKLSEHIATRTSRENQRMKEYFHHILKQRARVLGSATHASLNKLITLDVAKHVGLEVPKFVISNRRDDLIKIIDNDKKYITKAIDEGIFLWDRESAHSLYYTYTERVKSDMLSCYDEIIPPSLIQEEIAKQFELRIFYLDGRFYPTAILSQKDEKTRIDFRKYNETNPNRNVPFKLPQDIKEKLDLLFRELDLNTGSVDMIVAEDGRYYFLEINPVGQFAYPGASSGYFIERDIARWLVRASDLP